MQSQDSIIKKVHHIAVFRHRRNVTLVILYSRPDRILSSGYIDQHSWCRVDNCVFRRYLRVPSTSTLEWFHPRQCSHRAVLRDHDCMLGKW